VLFGVELGAVLAEGKLAGADDNDVLVLQLNIINTLAIHISTIGAVQVLDAIGHPVRLVVLVRDDLGMVLGYLWVIDTEIAMQRTPYGEDVVSQVDFLNDVIVMYLNQFSHSALSVLYL
jgi:hypothetical protein